MRCAHIPLCIIQLDPEYILVAEISYLSHSYSSYSLLGRAVSQPFLTVSGPILGTAIWAILGPATGWPSTKKYFGLGHGTGHDHAPHYGRGG